MNGGEHCDPPLGVHRILKVWQTLQKTVFHADLTAVIQKSVSSLQALV